MCLSDVQQRVTVFYVFVIKLLAFIYHFLYFRPFSYLFYSIQKLKTHLISIFNSDINFFLFSSSPLSLPLVYFFTS